MGEALDNSLYYFPGKQARFVNRSERESIYFYIYKDWYSGLLPPIYHPEDLDFHHILESHYYEIKDEIERNFVTGMSGLHQQNVPYKLDVNNWRVCRLYGFMLRYPQNLKFFPVLDGVLKKIPNLVTAQISVLGPNSDIKPHFGGSSAIIRSHLGIVVPGKYPDLGIRIMNKEYCWEEGKVFSFCESYRHYVWNRTNKNRIVLLIDTVHPDYADRKLFISGGVLAMLLLKMIIIKFPKTKNAPRWLTYLLHRFFTFNFMIVIYLQEKFKINITRLLQN